MSTWSSSGVWVASDPTEHSSRCRCACKSRTFVKLHRSKFNIKLFLLTLTRRGDGQEHPCKVNQYEEDYSLMRKVKDSRFEGRPGIVATQAASPPTGIRSKSIQWMLSHAVVSEKRTVTYRTAMEILELCQPKVFQICKAHSSGVPETRRHSPLSVASQALSGITDHPKPRASRGHHKRRTI